MTPKIFEYSYTVPPEDIDILNHVNNVVYLQYVQDAAIRHWTELTRENKFDAYLWVVGRHEIDYMRPALLGDVLQIKTWVGKTEGSSSVRHVEVFKEGKIITRTLTTWRLLDAQTFRPVEIPQEIIKILD
jgi:acyl-CoA thioester hydrolase